jgi:hypothetical protein
VTPGVAAPELDTTNYQALAQLSPTLATMFNRMQEQGDKQAQQAAESNEARLYNLTAEQTKAVLLDKDDEQVKAYLKQIGVEYWHNPLTREAGLRTLGARVVDQSGIPAALKGQMGMEKIARARMEAGPDPKAQQEAGFNAALALAEPMLGELTDGIKSEIAKGSFQQRLEALALEANIAATAVQGKIHREDTAEAIKLDLQSFMDLGPNLDPINNTMMDGMMVDWDAKLTELKKQYPSYDIKKMALDALESQLDRVAREYPVESPQFEAMVYTLDKLSESKGMLGTMDTELDNLRVQATAKIVRREARLSDPNNQRQRMESIRARSEDLFEAYLGSTARRTTAEVQKALMAHPEVKKMLDAGEATFDDLRKISVEWAQEEIEPKDQPLYHQLSMELREGHSKNFVDLMKGRHSDPDLQAKYDDLPGGMRDTLSRLWDSKVQVKWGRDKRHAAAEIQQALVSLKADQRVRGAPAHNAAVDALANLMIDAADYAIEDGKTADEVRKVWQDMLEEKRPYHEKEVQSLRAAENWATLSSSPDYTNAFRDAKDRLDQSYREKTAKLENAGELDRSKIPTMEAHQKILSAASADVHAALPALRQLAERQLREAGVHPSGPLLEMKVTELAVERLNNNVTQSYSQFDRKLEDAVAVAMAPNIQAYHDEDKKPTIPTISALPPGKGNMWDRRYENWGPEATEGIMDFRFGSAVGRQDMGENPFLTAVFTASRQNWRTRAERKMSNIAQKFADDARDGKRNSQTMEGLNMGVWSYGLTPKIISEGALHGAGLEKIAGADWRHDLSPRHIMLFTSKRQLDAFMKRAAEGGPEKDMLMNIGYDLSQESDRAKITGYQQDLINAQTMTPKAWEFIKSNRERFLQ